MRCFYNEGYYLPLPEGHPFPMEKFPNAHALLRAEAPDLEVVEAGPASRRQLERVHTREYLDSIREGTLTRYARNRLGLPHAARLLERSAMETAGTVMAARAALEDGIACNLAGGTHHAFPGRGLGFCVLNDVAVALADLRAQDAEAARHVLIVDTDAHQGNGTHAIVRDWPGVYTYSIHVGRNYPAAKEPGDRDVPLPRYVDGAAFLRELEATLPAAFEACEPDLVFWVSGADNHAGDRFGQMRLSTEDMAARDRAVLGLCRAWAAPTVVLYGGGYNRERPLTARLHANTVLAARGFAAGRVSGSTRVRAARA